jgi:hypothetical protein
VHLESWRWINNQLDAEDDVHTEPPLLHESSATQPVLYTTGAVDFVPFSWWWTCWCPKHVETPINTSSSASSWLFIHLQCALWYDLARDEAGYQIKVTFGEKMDDVCYWAILFLAWETLHTYIHYKNEHLLFSSSRWIRILSKIMESQITGVVN